MKILGPLACATALALLIAASSQADPLQMARVTPDELTWRPAPTGAQNAILVGDPRKAGFYVYHARSQAGFAAALRLG